MSLPEIDTSVTKDMYVGYTPDHIHHKVKPICAIIDGKALCAADGLMRVFGFYRDAVRLLTPLKSTLDIPGWCFGREVVWKDEEDGFVASFKLSKVISDIVVEVVAKEKLYYQITLEELCRYQAYTYGKINDVNMEFKFYTEELR